MRRVAPFRNLGLSGGKFRKRDPGDFPVGREIDNREPVQVGKLDVHAFCRTVRVRVEGDGTNAQIEVDDPDRLFGLRIDNRDVFPGDRPRNDKAAVRGDVGVVHRTVYRDAFDSLQRRGIDDIDSARRFPNRNIDVPSIMSDRDVVRMAAESDSCRDPQRLAVDNVQCAVGFIADVDAASVGSGCGAMAHFNSRDFSDDFIRDGVDDVHAVTRGVGLDDSYLAGRRGASGGVPTNPRGQSLPFRIVLRFPVFATVVTCVATHGLGERMQQKLALQRTAGNDSGAHDVEVFTRIFIVPR